MVHLPITRCNAKLRTAPAIVEANMGHFGTKGDYHSCVVEIPPWLERGDIKREWDFFTYVQTSHNLEVGKSEKRTKQGLRKRPVK